MNETIHRKWSTVANYELYVRENGQPLVREWETSREPGEEGRVVGVGETDIGKQQVDCVTANNRCQRSSRLTGAIWAGEGAEAVVLIGWGAWFLCEKNYYYEADF